MTNPNNSRYAAVRMRVVDLLEILSQEQREMLLQELTIQIQMDTVKAKEEYQR